MDKKANIRIGLIAFGILLIDQISKITVLKYLDYLNEKVILDGFFKFVHWGNTGAAWSVFRGNNELLAVIAVIALVILFLYRHHFDPHTLYGQTALGLIFGGIIGNLIDRLVHGHVIDFIYFYLHKRGGGDIGFPAFNAADSAICIGVALIFFLSWKTESVPASGDLGGSKAGLNSSGIHEP